MVQQEMKCPTCGGDKFKHKGGTTYRCLYCGGTIIGPEPPRATQQVNPASPYAFLNQDAPSSHSQVGSRPDAKDRITALVLCFFFGWVGAHKFYLRQTGWGVAYLVFFWTQIPAIVAFVEFIIMACESKAEFDRKYNS